MKAKLSIIVPVYNVEKYLADCMDSIRMQSYRNYEVILVDDGSTDRSSAMCDVYAAQDKRIKSIHIPNGGISQARNTGIDAAMGEYLFFLDSDDMIADRNVLRDMMRMVSLPGSDLVEGRTINFEEGVNVHYSLPQRVRYREVTLHARAKRRKPSGLLAGFLFSKRVIGDTRFSGELIVGEDVLFIHQIITKAGKMVLSDRLCMLRRVRKGSVTHSGLGKDHKDNLKRFETLMRAVLHGVNGGDALVDSYVVDQTNNINQVLYDPCSFDKEYIRKYIARFFPQYLGNGYLKVTTKVYLTLFLICPDGFCAGLRVYKRIKNRLIGAWYDRKGQ